MKVCKKCNKKYRNNNFKYCPECGDKLITETIGKEKFKYFNIWRRGRRIFIFDNFEYKAIKSEYIGYTQYLDLTKVIIDSLMIDLNNLNRHIDSISISSLENTIIANLFLDSSYFDNIVLCNLDKLNTKDSEKIWKFLIENNSNISMFKEELKDIKNLINGNWAIPDDIRLMIEVG